MSRICAALLCGNDAITGAFCERHNSELTEHGIKISAVVTMIINVHIAKVCDEIKEMLLEKNRKYGNSALEPLRLFSKSGAIEQLNVRIDDKLSRIRSGQIDEDEDVEKDLIGYLILKRVARLQDEKK